jgi:hypothetical protein
MWQTFSTSLKAYESLAVWLEGIALVAIFMLDWMQRRDQRRDREEQHRETLAQLNVSQAQADALINSERAWIMADVEWDSSKWADRKPHVLEGSGTGGDTTGIYVVLTCRNEGRSPAWIEEKRARFQIVDVLPDEPDLTSAEFIQAGPEPIGIGKALPHTNHISWQAIGAGHEGLGKMMVVYGVVKYRDIFNKHRETTFGYRITPSRELVRLEGSREYNRHT